jgi:hypothetical protein
VSHILASRLSAKAEERVCLTGLPAPSATVLCHRGEANQRYSSGQGYVPISNHYTHILPHFSPRCNKKLLHFLELPRRP